MGFAKSYSSSLLFSITFLVAVFVAWALDHQLMQKRIQKLENEIELLKARIASAEIDVELKQEFNSIDFSLGELKEQLADEKTTVMTMKQRR